MTKQAKAPEGEAPVSETQTPATDKIHERIKAARAEYAAFCKLEAEVFELRKGCDDAERAIAEASTNENLTVEEAARATREARDTLEIRRSRLAARAGQVEAARAAADKSMTSAYVSARDAIRAHFDRKICERAEKEVSRFVAELHEDFQHQIKVTYALGLWATKEYAAAAEHASPTAFHSEHGLNAPDKVMHAFEVFESIA